jgi:hypothetical protein
MDEWDNVTMTIQSYVYQNTVTKKENNKNIHINKLSLSIDKHITYIYFISSF